MYFLFNFYFFKFIFFLNFLFLNQFFSMFVSLLLFFYVFLLYSVNDIIITKYKLRLLRFLDIILLCLVQIIHNPDCGYGLISGVDLS